MNKIYKVIFNQVLNRLIVVSEITRGKGKSTTNKQTNKIIKH
ncbi:ESPR domain-containing protein [Avibacterium sp. 21-599]